MKFKRSAAGRLFGALLAGMAAAFLCAGADAQELNALVWCDHSDPGVLKPFEEANGVKVNVKEFEGTGAGLAIVEQSQPGDWDVMVIDSIDVRRGVEKGLFEPLPEDQLPLADIFPDVMMDEHGKIDGKRYGVTEKFGYNTIGFNKEKVDPTGHAVPGSPWRIRNTRAALPSTTIICPSSAWRRSPRARRRRSSPRAICPPFVTCCSSGRPIRSSSAR